MQKLICFDLDGTLTAITSWEAFNLRLGISPEQDKSLFDQYVTGTLDYKSWTMELVKIYKENGSVTREDLESFSQTIEPRPEAAGVILNMKEKGYRVILISSAIDVVAKSITARLGIGEWFTTNKAVYDDEGNLIDIETLGDERDAKLLLLETFCLKNGYDIADVIAVGDGGNDLEIFKHTKGIVLGNNKELVPLAWKQVESLAEIKELV